MGEPAGPDGNVYASAHSHMGPQVGRGECWGLADQALKQVGARSSTTVGKDDDYVWGISIDPHHVTPGDILQLRDHAPRCPFRRSTRTRSS